MTSRWRYGIYPRLEYNVRSDGTIELWTSEPDPSPAERTWFGEGVDPSEWGGVSPDTAAIYDALRTLWLGGAIDTRHQPWWNNNITETDMPFNPETGTDHIDTSTTAGRIAVMQAWEEGRDIEVAVLGGDSPWRKAHGGLNNLPNGEWDWKTYDYRIAPPPPVKTALQAAHEYLKKNPDMPDSNTASKALMDLLVFVDSSPTVTITEQGIRWSVNMKPGRYRLVRDDE